MNTKKSYHVKVEGTNLVRDTNTMGLSNRDLTGKNEYLMKVNMLKGQKEEINKLKAEISEVKNLLKQLLEKGTNG